MYLNLLNQMTFDDIRSRTRFIADYYVLKLMWKREYRDKEGSAEWQLSNNEGLITELQGDSNKLYKFIKKHEEQIDKVAMLLFLHKAYSENNRDFSKEKREIEKILKGIKSRYIYPERTENGNITTGLFRIDTIEVVEGKKINRNNQKIKELLNEINFTFEQLVQNLPIEDIKKICDTEFVGKYLEEIALYKALVSKYGEDKTNELLEQYSIDIIRQKFLDRREESVGVAKAISEYLEDINIDKLLLCLGYRYIKVLEESQMDGEEAEKKYKAQKVMLRYIAPKTKLNIDEDEEYNKQRLQNDMDRIVCTEGNIKYLSKECAANLRDRILKNEITLNDILLQEFNLIRFSHVELTQIAEQNPENYIFLLNNGKNKDSKETILANIINAGECSTTLLRVLCEKLDINIEDALNLFENGLLEKNEALEIVKEKVGTIITDEILIAKYKKYKSTVNQDYCQRKESEQEETEKQKEARRKLERYATAYVYTEILGKKPDEILDKNYELAEKIMGENINPLDVILLYEFNLIDIECAIALGDKEVKDALIDRKTLRLKDAKYLRKEWNKTETGKLNDDDIIKILIGQTYEQQIIFLAFVLRDDYKKINEFSTYLKIGQGMNNEKNNGKNNGKNTRNNENSNEKKKEESESTIPSKMREPIAKVSLLSAFDPDAMPLEGIIDGHVIIVYPNLEKVCIEKLHKIGRNGEKRNENKAATYFMTKEEFEKYKEDIIKDGRVNRSFLIEKWMRDPEHWLAHNGNEYWEKELLKMFGVEKEDSRYSEEEKERIKNLAQMSIRSKTESR